MATLVSCTVDPGGTGDYVSLNAAEAANFGATGADLVSNDEYVECSCICTNGAADTTAVTISGQTTDATRDITITVPSAYRHDGTFPESGNVYRLTVSGLSHGLTVSTNFTTVSGIAASNEPGVVDSAVLLVDTCSDATVTSCITQYKGSLSGGIGLYVYGSSGTATLSNNLVFNATFVGCHVKASAGICRISSCTIVDCDQYGLVRSTTNTVTAYAKNILCFNNTDDYAGTLHGDSTNNAYSEGADPGSNGIDISSYLSTPEDLFVDYDNDDFHLKAPTGIASTDHDLYGAGTDLSGEGVTTDIDGYTRVRWDVGADEVTTNGGPVLRPCTVDPDGTGDYASLNAGEAANFGASNADLTSVDEYCECSCICTGGTADETTVYVSGQTTDATRDLTITVGSAYRHNGTFPDSGVNIYRMVITNVGGLRVNTDYTTIVGVAVHWTATASSSMGLGFVLGTGGLLNSCLSVVVSNGQTSCRAIQTDDNTAGSSEIVVNCIVIGDLGSGSIGIDADPKTEDVILFNNTATGFAYGLLTRSGSGDTVLKNNLAFGNTDDYNGTFHGDSTHNAYSQGTDPGSNGTDISGYTAAQLFQDPDNDNYLLKGRNPMGRVGTNLYTDASLPVTTDILGNARRSIGTDWCVGAHISDDSDPSILNTVQHATSRWSLDQVRTARTYHPQ